MLFEAGDADCNLPPNSARSAASLMVSTVDDFMDQFFDDADVGNVAESVEDAAEPTEPPAEPVAAETAAQDSTSLRMLVLKRVKRNCCVYIAAGGDSTDPPETSQT